MMLGLNEMNPQDWELYLQLMAVGPAVGGAYIPGMYRRTCHYCS
jgi:hypothetical protein